MAEEIEKTEDINGQEDSAQEALPESAEGTEKEQGEASEEESGVAANEENGEPAEEENSDAAEEEADDGETELEFDVMMSSDVLYDYLLRHSYSSSVGLIGSCFGAFGIIMFFCYGGWLYLIMGIIVLGYLPLTLFKRSKVVMLTNPAYKRPLRYRFTENGFSVSQEEARSRIEWDGCRKAVATKKSIIIYTGRNNASIFPRDQIPGGASALISVIARHMEPKRIKIRY